jgi:glycosyltransferase involved in cell wall biosynthesis
MMLAGAFRITRTILKKAPLSETVISAQDPLEIGWLAWLLATLGKVRLQIQVHGDYFDSGWCGRSLVRYVKRYFALVLLKRAPAVRVVSERIKRSLVKRGIPEARITVLPIRPELEHFLSYTATSYEPSTPFVFLFVGRLAPEKDIPRIIRAFKEVSVRMPQARLRLVGSGGEEASLRALTTSLGIADAVTFVPWTQNVAEEMSCAHAFVLASKHEAYGLVLLEAMAVGLPLVTTDVGCVGEVVKDGVHGIVIKEKGATPLAHALECMMTEDAFREACRTHAKRTAEEVSTQSASAYTEAWVTSLSRAQ